VLFNILEHTHVVFHPDSGYLWSFFTFFKMSVVQTWKIKECRTHSGFLITFSFAVFSYRSSIFFENIYLLSSFILILSHRVCPSFTSFLKRKFDHNRMYCLSDLSVIAFVNFVQNVFDVPCEIVLLKMFGSFCQCFKIIFVAV
jgi:hypothetical protein